MKLRQFTLAAFLLLSAILATCATSAFAQGPDLSGTWAFKTVGAQGPSQQTVTIAQSGNTFTGEMTTAQGDKEPIKDGTVKGDDVQFVIERKRPTGETASVAYKGKVSGNEIKGSFTGASGREVQFTATKQ